MTYEQETKPRESRPVKVRAGFAVFQPRRLGRLLEEPTAEAPTRQLEPRPAPQTEAPTESAAASGQAEGAPDLAPSSGPAKRSRPNRRQRDGAGRQPSTPTNQSAGQLEGQSPRDGAQCQAGSQAEGELSVAELVEAVQQQHQAGTATPGGAERARGRQRHAGGRSRGDSRSLEGRPYNRKNGRSNAEHRPATVTQEPNKELGSGWEGEPAATHNRGWDGAPAAAQHDNLDGQPAAVHPSGWDGEPGAVQPSGRDAELIQPCPPGDGRERKDKERHRRRRGGFGRSSASKAPKELDMT